MGRTSRRFVCPFALSTGVTWFVFNKCTFCHFGVWHVRGRVLEQMEVLLCFPVVLRHNEEVIELSVEAWSAIGAMLAVGVAIVGFMYGMIRNLRNDMNTRFDQADQREDARFAKVDERLDRMDERLDRMDERIDRMGERIVRMEERLDDKLSRVNDRIDMVLQNQANVRKEPRLFVSGSRP